MKAAHGSKIGLVGGGAAGECCGADFDDGGAVGVSSPGADEEELRGAPRLSAGFPVPRFPPDAGTVEKGGGRLAR